MILYVMRHAEAVEGSEALADEWRYLTEKGRSAARKVSSSISRSGPKPRLIITSPLTRAVQTAEIAALKACRKNVVVSSGLLLPVADTGSVITHLKTCRDARRVMLVGHEPQLGMLVASLLGRGDQPITLKKAPVWPWNMIRTRMTSRPDLSAICFPARRGYRPSKRLFLQTTKGVCHVHRPRQEQ